MASEQVLVKTSPLAPQVELHIPGSVGYRNADAYNRRLSFLIGMSATGALISAERSSNASNRIAPGAN